MKCILEKQAKKEHAIAATKPENYHNRFVSCPLFAGRQICFWCCLHIRDIAEPLNRGDYSLAHPEYEALVPKETGRTWDEIWHTCSRCSTGG
jgi:hypothetical protein